MVKLAGTERTQQTGPARVFESEEECFRAVKDQKINAGDVVVIRNEGPIGGPGMREMLQVTAAIVGEGLGRDRRDGHRRALLGRHPRPDDRPRRPGGGQRRADRGDPRGRSDHRRHRRPPPRVDLSDEEIAARVAAYESPPSPFGPGVMAKYAATVSSASQGAVTAGG